MSILVITHTTCHGKNYECRRKVNIGNNQIPVAEIVRFFWPRLAPNFVCKSIRFFDKDIDDFIDVERPEFYTVKPKQKFEFRYAEGDVTVPSSSIVNNAFYYRVENTSAGIAFYVQEQHSPNESVPSVGNVSTSTASAAMNLVVKADPTQSPIPTVDLPSTSTIPQESRETSSSPASHAAHPHNYHFDNNAETITINSDSASPASASGQKDEFGEQLNEFFNNPTFVNNYSALFGNAANEPVHEEPIPRGELDLATLIVPNAIEHLELHVERGSYALIELQKYADGEVNFFQDQVKRILTLAMGDFLFDNYLDNCNAPVRREFCRRYLAQLPGNLRLEIFSNSKTVGTVDCYIKNKKKRIRKMALRENGGPPAKRPLIVKPIEPPPERPRPPELLAEIRSGHVDPFSSEMMILYKKTNSYRQSLVSALNKTPGADTVTEVINEFPLLAKNPSLLEQDFFLATTRINTETVNFEHEWNHEWIPRIQKYFATIAPTKYSQLNRYYQNVADRGSVMTFAMVFCLLEYNALNLAQIKTMVVECHAMSISEAVAEIRGRQDNHDPLILANDVGFRVCVGEITLPLTPNFATALKQLVQVHYVFRITHKVLFRPIYQVLETVYGLSTNALRFSQRALSLVENLRSAQVD